MQNKHQPGIQSHCRNRDREKEKERLIPFATEFYKAFVLLVFPLPSIPPTTTYNFLLLPSSSIPRSLVHSTRAINNQLFSIRVSSSDGQSILCEKDAWHWIAVPSQFSCMSLGSDTARSFCCCARTDDSCGRNEKEKKKKLSVINDAGAFPRDLFLSFIVN